MRCKNCKKKIDNPNLYRCPHCGKQLAAKKERNLKSDILNGSFIAAVLLLVVADFFGLFFVCEYYSKAVLILTLTLSLVSFPFVFGKGLGIKHTLPDLFAAALNVPLLVNWVSILNSEKYTVEISTAFFAYFGFLALSLILCDIFLILRSSEVLKRGKIYAFICLGLAAAAVVFSVAFYAYAQIVKPMAVFILTVNAFVPLFIAFYNLKKDIEA